MIFNDVSKHCQARGDVEMKKQWERPQLIVLVRSKPEENVLAACKGNVGGSPEDEDRNCIRYPIGGEYCDAGCLYLVGT